MQEVILKAKYDIRLFFGMLLFLAAGAYFGWQYFSGKDQAPEQLVFAAFFLTVLVILPLRLIKQIRLRNQDFTVETFVLPARSIRYDEVTGLSLKSIVTQQGAFSIATLTNAEEIYELMKQRVKTGSIERSPDRAADQRASILVASLRWAMLIALLLSAAFIFIWPVSNQYWFLLRFLLFFIPAAWLVYQFLKRRQA